MGEKETSNTSNQSSIDFADCSNSKRFMKFGSMFKQRFPKGTIEEHINSLVGDFYFFYKSDQFKCDNELYFSNKGTFFF